MGFDYDNHLSAFVKKQILKLIKRCFVVNDICNIYEINRSTYYRFLSKIKRMHNKEKIKQTKEIQNIQSNSDNKVNILDHNYENNILNILNDNTINIDYVITKKRTRKEKILVDNIMIEIINYKRR